MIAVSIFNNKNIALFGLGESGLVTAQALKQGGARIVAFDDELQACERARQAGIEVADLRLADWHQISALILTPGVPLTHPEPHWTVRLAQQHHVEIIGDIELFMRERALAMVREGIGEEDCPLIAITGTNGKSTTTALIAHLLQASGHDVAMGGNIGKPVLALEPVRKGLYTVIECSSYQIDLAPSLAATIGILLNLTPDHIDRHGTFEHYGAVKRRLVAQAHTALVALDDAPCRTIAAALKASFRADNKKLVCFSSRPDRGDKLDWKADWFADGTSLIRQHHKAAEPIASLKNIASLRGQHNAQNALAALAACAQLGVDMKQVLPGLTSFKGLAHRMEEVGRTRHVVFINDSKATNAQACAPALASFAAIYWIAGGLAKQGGIETLRPFFGKIRHAYLIGDAAQDFRQTLETPETLDTKIDVNIDAAVPVTMSGTLAQAVSDAARDAFSDTSGEDVAVLFSPACASFDQFANYVVRGEAFRQLVDELLMCSGKS